MRRQLVTWAFGIAFWRQVALLASTLTPALSAYSDFLTTLRHYLDFAAQYFQHGLVMECWQESSELGKPVLVQIVHGDFGHFARLLRWWFLVAMGKIPSIWGTWVYFGFLVDFGPNN